MHPPASPRTGLPERSKEALPIDVIAEDRLLPIAPIEQMINGPANSTRALRAIPPFYQTRKPRVESSCRDSQTSLKENVQQLLFCY